MKPRSTRARNNLLEANGLFVVIHSAYNAALADISATHERAVVMGLFGSLFLPIFVAMFGTAIASEIGVEEDCSAISAMTFEGWKGWAAITPNPVKSDAHGGNWVGIFTNQRALEIYLQARAPYPECAMIVKPVYKTARGKFVIKLAIMVKMAPGYDPGNSDWLYALYDQTGKNAQRQGRLMDCIICHKHATETDYLFSGEVMKALIK